MLRGFFQILLVTFVLVAAAQAQPESIKWGDIPDEHLDMAVYSGDPEAHAVILGDFGNVKVEDDWSVTYHRHRRVKILDEGGFDSADVTLAYLHEDGYQRISKIQGQTFIRKPDGSVRRVKLDKKSIYTEDLENGYKRVKFTLPALEPGAVVEYRYRLKTESPLQLPRWYFQDEQPVLTSEFRLEYPQQLAYTVVTQGAPIFTVKSEIEGVRTSGATRVFRWVAEEVPALREERYMTTLEDYIQKIDIQLVEYYRAGFGAVRVIKTWDLLAEELLDNASFGRRLKVSGAVRQEAERITQGLTEPAEKARAIYDFVRSTVVWNGRYRLFADERLENVLRDKRGSSAEINLLLVALLREAGLSAAPAMLSTRENGRIIRVYPLVSQFNYALAAIRQGGRWRLLDATDPFRPYGLLPVHALSESALVIADGPEWVGVGAGESEHAVELEAVLEADGSLVGTLRSEKSGYSGVSARGHIQDDGPEGYVSGHLLDDVPGIEIESVSVGEEDDADAPLVTEVAFRIPEYAQSVGGLLLVNPIAVTRSNEAPFTLEQRTYPVDFAYPSTTTYTASITLPDGYVVDEAPEDALLLLPLRGGGYERAVSVEEGVLNVSARFMLRKTLFEPNVYRDIKQFFDRTVATDAETVVLVKGTTEEPGVVETHEAELEVEEGN